MTRPVLRLKAGDHRKVRIGLRNADESARDLTGETLEFQAAAQLGSAAVTIFKTDGDGIEVVDAALGLIDIVFRPEDTENAPGLLLWDLRVTDVLGEVITFDFGSDAASPETYGVLLIERALKRTG